MIFRCPNIQAHYNEAVIFLNFGTSKNNEIFHLEQMENLIFLGVPILKHNRVHGVCHLLFSFIAEAS